MTLEQEWFKQEGAPVPRGPERPLRSGDILARGAAYVILLMIFAFSLWALSLVSVYMSYVVIALLFLVVVRLMSSVRELRNSLAELRQDVAAIRRGPPVAPPPEAPSDRGPPGS